MTLTSSDTAKASSTTKRTAEDTGDTKSFVVAHFSDPHIAHVDQIVGRDLLSKRLFGYLRWKLKRRFEQSYELLTILHKDLQLSKPDHIAITGDLTQLSLPAEFEKAREWLQSIGTPEQVTVIPGNHDTYVKTAWHQSFALWLDYMLGDSKDLQADSITSLEELYPTLRIRNRIALIGINTAQPSAPHLATGTIGTVQLKKLESILKQLNGQRFFRIVLIHHPPISGVVNWRRSLTDAQLLQTLLERYGAELVLFGHAHKTAEGNLATPAGLIPAVGAPAVLSLRGSDARRSRYFLYKIMPSVDGWNVIMNERLFSLEQHRFIGGRQQEYSFPHEAS
jgi:3',5'-cyclic AMP phosphodiesterase CpdA